MRQPFWEACGYNRRMRSFVEQWANYTLLVKIVICCLFFWIFFTVYFLRRSCLVVNCPGLKRCKKNAKLWYKTKLVKWTLQRSFFSFQFCEISFHGLDGGRNKTLTLVLFRPGVKIGPIFYDDKGQWYIRETIQDILSIFSHICASQWTLILSLLLHKQM